MFNVVVLPESRSYVKVKLRIYRSGRRARTYDAGACFEVPLLNKAGHEVSSILMGYNERRTVPEFFLEKIQAPVTYFESPNFAIDASEQSVRVWPTVTQNLKKKPAV